MLAIWICQREAVECFLKVKGNVCIGETRNIYRVLYYPRFQASTSGLATHPPVDEEGPLYSFITILDSVSVN